MRQVAADTPLAPHACARTQRTPTHMPLSLSLSLSRALRSRSHSPWPARARARSLSWPSLGRARKPSQRLRARPTLPNRIQLKFFSSNLIQFDPMPDRRRPRRTTRASQDLATASTRRASSLTSSYAIAPPREAYHSCKSLLFHQGSSGRSGMWSKPAPLILYTCPLLSAEGTSPALPHPLYYSSTIPAFCRRLPARALRNGLQRFPAVKQEEKEDLPDDNHSLGLEKRLGVDQVEKGAPCTSPLI